MTAGRYTSPLAEELAADALERFLRYVRIDTQSVEGADSYPSTAKQLDLLRLLVDELHGAGLEDAALDEHGYVFATLPATTERPAPTVGLLAHVDTAPAVTGAGVDPQVHRAWDGEPIALPRNERHVLDPATMKEIGNHVGCDLVTTDGRTLLGADDKAGVAEIMAAVAYLARHPELPHGRIRVAFTPDEEVGEGTRYFDLERFGADLAYTLDGSDLAEIQDETFSATAVTITIRGRSVHPGEAKGVLVNALKLAARLLSWLPDDRLSPETTAEREGYVHPAEIAGSSGEVAIDWIVRDFDLAQLERHEAYLRGLAERLQAEEPRAEVVFERRTQYLNMKEELDKRPEIVAVAEQAIRGEGLEPRRTMIRGGTDGSRLTEKGLPTPNLFTGGREYHSEREWLCVQDMGAAAAVVVRLAQLWAQR